MSLPNLEVFNQGAPTGLKAGLKELIRCKGLDEYDDDDLWRKQPTYELTEDEQCRAEQRKENNKRAAQKSRAKKRGRLDYLEKRAKELKTQREQLLQERHRLNIERERLKKVLIQHANTCPGVKEIIAERLAIY